MKREELLKGLTNEQIKKAKNCKNAEELLALAKEEGIELNDDQLMAVSGGGCVETSLNLGVCPNCGSSNFTYTVDSQFSTKVYHCECRDCQERWTAKDF